MELAHEIVNAGITYTISASTVRRILAHNPIQP